MKIDHFDIKVTMWQRIKFSEPKTVEEVRKVIEAKNINAFWDEETDGILYENLVDSEEYEYESAEYPDVHITNDKEEDWRTAQVYTPFIHAQDETP